MEPECGYLFSICWSASRPLVFAVGTAAGSILIYDLKVSYVHVAPSSLGSYVCTYVCEGGRERGRGVALGLLTYEQMLSKQSYNLELVVCIRLSHCTIQCPPPGRMNRPPGWGEVFRVRGDLYE